PIQHRPFREDRFARHVRRGLEHGIEVADPVEPGVAPARRLVADHVDESKPNASSVSRSEVKSTTQGFLIPVVLVVSVGTDLALELDRNPGSSQPPTHNVPGLAGAEVPT